MKGYLSQGGGGLEEDNAADGNHPSRNSDSERAQQQLLQSSSRPSLPAIKLVPLGEKVSEFLEGVMVKSTADDTTTGNDKKLDDRRAKEVKSKTTTTSVDIMDQPPKLKREYQSKRKENKGWSEEDMLNDLDATMDDDQNNDASKNNNEEEEDEMSIDNMSITIEEGEEENEEDGNDAINSMLEEKLSSYSLDCYPYTFSPLLLFSSAKYFDKGYSNYNAVAAFFAPALADLGVKKKEEDNEDGKLDGGDAGVAAAPSPESNRSNQDNSPSRSPPRKSPRNGGGSSSTSPNDEDQYEGGINMLNGVVYDRKNMTYDEVFNHIVATQSLVTCCIDAHFTAFQILNSQCLIYYDPLSPNIRVAVGEASVQDAALFLLMKCKYGDDVHVQENKNYYTGGSSSQLQRRM